MVGENHEVGVEMGEMELYPKLNSQWAACLKTRDLDGR